MDGKSDALGGLVKLLADTCRREDDALPSGTGRTDQEIAGGDPVSAAEGYLPILEEILFAIGDGISIQDADFRVIYQNPAHRRMTGDQLGELCYEAYAGQDRICDGCPLERTFRDGTDHVLEKNGRNRRGTFSVEIKTSALRGADGRIVAGIEVVRDRSARRRAEERQSQAEARYRSIFEQSPDAILIIDSETALPVEFNGKAVDLLGYSPKELSALPVFRFEARESPEEIRARMKKILRNGRDDFETRIRTKRGEIRDVSVSIRIIELGERRYFQTILRDITDRRKQEVDRARTEKLESVGILAGGLAHDFNNRLTVILGNISMARKEAEPTTPMAARLRDAENALLRARDMTQQLLTFSRGGMPVRKPLVLAEVFRNASLFAARSEEIGIDVSLPGDLWPVLADEGQIRQVLYVLLANAEQAMARSGEIRVVCENVPADRVGGVPLAKGDYVRISVSDTGTGIAKEHLPMIFDPYFSTKEGRSGLGLTAAHSIVRKHEGAIVVESEIGLGTTVRLYLPAADRRFGEAGDGGSGPGRKKRVLVMDDEECVRETARDMLQVLGYEADCAREGEEAIRLYREAMERGEPFAAVIMDLVVHGGMGGRDAIRKLLDIDPVAKVIVSSGYSDDPMMADHEQYGFRGTAPKPYTLNELRTTLSGIV